MNKSFAPDQRTSKRRRTCLNNGIRTPLLISLTSAATHATSQETQYHSLEQSQQSSASRDPSLKHILIHRNSSHFFDYKVSSDGCDDTNTNSTSGMTTKSITHQSFSHPDSVPYSRSNFMQGAYESILSQCLRYDDQCRASLRDAPILQLTIF